VTERDRFSQEFDMTFDLSVHDMFVCWERGACCYPCREIRDAAGQVYSGPRADHVVLGGPSVVALLSNVRLLQPRCFPSLRIQPVLRRSARSHHAQDWQEGSSQLDRGESLWANGNYDCHLTLPLVSIKSSTGVLKRDRADRMPFAGQQCCVVDHERGEVSETGDLLAGSQVTDGYWNNLEKTQGQFVRFQKPADSLVPTGTW